MSAKLLTWHIRSQSWTVTSCVPISTE